jgi:hypothetical protein
MRRTIPKVYTGCQRRPLQGGEVAADRRWHDEEVAPAGVAKCLERAGVDELIDLPDVAFPEQRGSCTGAEWDLHRRGRGGGGRALDGVEKANHGTRDELQQFLRRARVDEGGAVTHGTSQHPAACGVPIITATPTDATICVCYLRAKGAL